MIQILHISDTHAETRTLKSIDKLITQVPDCDVVAFTGDSTSGYTPFVPESWDEWPFKLKLSVPGNHDRNYSFKHLNSWHHQTPWSTLYKDLLFIGLPLKHKGMDTFIRNISQYDIKLARGIVVLSHICPINTTWYDLGSVLKDLADYRKILLLHGHEHPVSFSGHNWENFNKIDNIKYYYLSHVCSSIPTKRGIGHLITWNNYKTFKCEVVQSE